MQKTIETLQNHILSGFAKKDRERDGRPRRTGVELKFPAVTADGRAAPEAFARELFETCAARPGWEALRDGEALIGALRPGPLNQTLIGCETSFSKIEISMAHHEHLHALDEDLRATLDDLRPLCQARGVHLLGLGAQPFEPPAPRLMQKKTRNQFWNRVFDKSDAEEARDGVHLFTVNATNQVHLDLRGDEAAPALNAFNASAAIQIALMANSGIVADGWNPGLLCAAESFWDRWLPPAEARAGVPARPVRDLADWARLLMDLRPVYVKRPGHALGLARYRRFADYFADAAAEGEDLAGRAHALMPQIEDFDLHTTFNWFCARISQYHTLEIRACDQQPPDALMAPAALSLGIVENLTAAAQILEERSWDDWRALRLAAVRQGLRGDGELPGLCRRWLDVADEGLRRRGFGEEAYLHPLRKRLEVMRTPAEEAGAIFQKQGLSALIEARTIFHGVESGVSTRSRQ